MRLFHTGFEVIKNPDIRYGRKNADFGQGFYLTDDEEFSCRWAKERRGKTPVINTYEMEFDGLKVHYFKREAEWFSYIFNNRRGRKDTIDADVIIGPIANDTIYDTLGMITSGLLKDDEALALLQLGYEYRQFVLKTDRAANNLKWIESREILSEESERYRNALEREQEEYLRMIAEKIEGKD
ncbi:MAG: DUF3990 domain-containing protein [Lachnospiraceae bacterium]|nr:DUF3990 domain-containing protein [Lachnospiraceae bacterium]